VSTHILASQADEAQFGNLESTFGHKKIGKFRSHWKMSSIVKIEKLA
jgi:hypothetical protein